MIQLSCWQMVWILMFLLPLVEAFNFLQADGCPIEQETENIGSGWSGGACVSNQFSKRLSPTSIIHTQTVICLSQCFLISVLMLLICFYCFLQLALSLSHFKASGVNTVILNTSLRQIPECSFCSHVSTSQAQRVYAYKLTLTKLNLT